MNMHTESHNLNCYEPRTDATRDEHSCRRLGDWLGWTVILLLSFFFVVHLNSSVGAVSFIYRNEINNRGS